MTAKTPTALFDTIDNVSPFTDIQTSYPYPKDYRYATQFLYEYRGSIATFNAYRREVERLMQWCWLIGEKPLADITRSDLELFIEFCQSPPLSWIATKKSPRFVIRNGQALANPSWRPFVVTVSKIVFKQGVKANPKDYQLSQKALQAVFAILSSFFNFLVLEGHLSANPLLQMRQKSKYLRKYQSKAVIRKLTELQWSFVIETAEKMAADEPVHERTLFIMNALYAMYLRISELAASDNWVPEMGDFRQDHDGHWWFTTVGKGNKERQITVSDSMLAVLKRYRSSLDLSALPYPGERTALITKIKGQGPVTSTRHIRMIVQDCFDLSVKRMEKEGFSDEIDNLKAATVHWLRHTGISEDVKFRPREHVRDDAGHSSSAITDKYIDIELRERHASGKSKLVKPI